MVGRYGHLGRRSMLRQLNFLQESGSLRIKPAHVTGSLFGSSRWHNFSTTAELAGAFTAPQQSSVPSPSPTTVKLHNLLPHGCLSYPKTWAFQQVLLQQRLHHRVQMQQQQQGQTEPWHSSEQSLIDLDRDRDSDCIVILEHSPVYTLGRGADENHLTFVRDQQQQQEEGESSLCFATEVSKKLSRRVRGPGTARLVPDKIMENELKAMLQSTANNSHGTNITREEQSMLSFAESLTKSVSPVVAPNGVPIYRVDRGGEVTYHGPSQLVVYPMLDLKNGSSSYKADLHWYLRQIEEVVILTLEHYGIDGKRDDANTGVWVGKQKVAAVGISSSRWITTHGFALNVDPDLSGFDTSIILPCGIEGRGVTSMGEILRNRTPDNSVPNLNDVASVAIQSMETIFGVTIQ